MKCFPAAFSAHQTMLCFIAMRKLEFLGNVSHAYPLWLTSQITGGKKQSEERAALFAVRVNLPC